MSQDIIVKCYVTTRLLIYTNNKSARKIFFASHSKIYESISIKFNIDVQFTIMKVLTRAFSMCGIEKKYEEILKNTCLLRVFFKKLLIETKIKIIPRNMIS